MDRAIAILISRLVFYQSRPILHQHLCSTTLHQPAMDFVHSAPSGLEISNLLVAMQELAMLDVTREDIPGQLVAAKLLTIGIPMLRCIRGPASVGGGIVAVEIRELLLTCKKIKGMLDEWNRGWQIYGTVMETWLDALEHYCYDIEDLVDGLRLGVSGGTTLYKAVKLHLYLERVSVGIEHVRAGQHNLNAEESSLPCYGSLLSDRSLFVRGTSIDLNIRTIIAELLSEGHHQSGGVSIIGMDGLGKTSLARAILSEKEIQAHFDYVLSASVSAHFQTEDVVRKLTADRQLLDIIQDNTVLIILDDLWSVADEEWERFQYMFLRTCRSWKILTTTRNPRVAEVTESTAHYLDRMTDEECKSLIMVIANLSGSDYDIWASDIELIAEKCQGMPIIANKFGFKLSKKRSLGERIDSIALIKSTNLWELPEFRQVFPCLKLNEPKLPPHLRRCFAYFSLFSPDHKFNKDDLIQLWEAEGFVRPQQKLGWQPTGSECFDDLLSRSILQPLKSSNEMQLMYEIHQVNHEFAELLASKAFIRIKEGAPDFISSCRNVRHLSLGCKDIDHLVLKQIQECKGLRSFLLQHEPMSEKHTISLTFLRKFESLRLLALSRTKISKLPLFVSRLQHLRYLDLSESDIESLPEPISPLGALQTLKLQKCVNLKRLPKDLNQLANLMHLYVDVNLLDDLPTELGMLTNLETLSSFVVKGNKIAELKNMKHLREIQISGLKSIRSMTEARESMLSRKHLLTRLVLEWQTDDYRVEVENVEDVLQGLEPHSELKHLTVRNYWCEKFPAWLTSPSRKLVSVHLENCRGCKVLPCLGQLPLLKTLVLQSIVNVEIVDEQFCGHQRFRSLESLEFCNMTSLLEWIGLEAGDMPCLQSLKVVKCPLLVRLPSLYWQSRLVNLEIIACPVLESLPEISYAMKAELGKLIIIDSPLVEKRCQVGGVDCVENEDCTYTKGFSSESLPLHTNKVHQPEVHPAKPPRLDDEDHTLQSPIISLASSPDTDSTETEIKGYNDEIMGKHVFELEKKVEGKSILFLFGVGYEFEKAVLIQLWMALELLTEEPMEENGAMYFEKLVSEGYMICSNVANSLYKVKMEKLRTDLDVIRDELNYVILDNESRNDAASAETLHASVFCDEIDASIFKTLGGFNRLRTLLFLGNYGSRLQKVPRDLFLCYESLVTLDLSGTHIKELPSSALKMINLRYLDLSWTLIEVLSERIDRFQKLQTLKLEGCARLCRLPKEMKWLTELRHLQLDVRSLAAFPEGIGALLKIRTLSAFPVGIKEGLRVTELKHLNNIAGKFCIAKMENVRSAGEAKDALLTAKRNIKKLELRWSDCQLQEPREEDESILENLCPHSDLEELQILCYPGTRFPNWTADVSFKKLVSITMFGCVNAEMLPCLDKLHSLVSLELIGLSSVTKMDCKGEADHVAFPTLQNLAVDGMLNLQIWAEARQGDYPCLGELRIKDCPKLPELPSLFYLPSLKHLEVSGCKKLSFVSEKQLSTSIQQLIVEDCPLIEERCLEGVGEDWHKIQHVPAIWIDRVAIQTHEEGPQ